MPVPVMLDRTLSGRSALDEAQAGSLDAPGQRGVVTFPIDGPPALRARRKTHLPEATTCISGARIRICDGGGGPRAGEGQGRVRAFRVH